MAVALNYQRKSSQNRRLYLIVCDEYGLHNRAQPMKDPSECWHKFRLLIKQQKIPPKLISIGVGLLPGEKIAGTLWRIRPKPYLEIEECFGLDISDKDRVFVELSIQNLDLQWLKQTQTMSLSEICKYNALS